MPSCTSFSSQVIAKPALALLVLLSSVSVTTAEPEHPLWWSDGDPPVINPSSAPSNYSPVNTGQAKWMASEALRALNEVAPGIAFAIQTDLAGTPPDFEDRIVQLDVPENKDSLWQKTQQTILSLGQLKAMSLPFYNRFNESSPDWVKSQIERNHDGQAQINEHYWQVSGDVNHTEGGYYPWNPQTPLLQNKLAANIGQLKALFALRFSDLPESALDFDNDGLLDLWEQSIIDYDPNDSITQVSNVLPSDDFDGDGVSNADEFTAGTSPSDPSDAPESPEQDTDGDGVPDSEDGWALCDHLAPARLAKPTYVVIPFDKPEGVERLRPHAFNNNGRALLGSGVEGEYKHYYFNGEELIDLPPYEEESYSGDYHTLTESNYFVHGDYGFAYQGLDPGNHSNEKIDTYLDGVIQYTYNPVERYESLYEEFLYFETFFAMLTEAGELYMEETVDPYGYNAPISHRDDKYAILNSEGEGREILVNSLGWTAQREGFELRHLTRRIGRVISINTNNLILAEDTTNYGYIKNINLTDFNALPVVFPDDHNYLLNDKGSVSLNNKNTLLMTYFDSDKFDIWLDTKAGIKNDQPVDNNPVYDKITWDDSWGATPPSNLNAQMRGHNGSLEPTRNYGYGNYYPRWQEGDAIWQNGEWLALSDLVAGDEWTDLVIYDMNDHGDCVGEATNSKGERHPVMFKQVGLAVDSNRNGEVEFVEDQTSSGKPYRFWINNDFDTEDDDESSAGEQPDNIDGSIASYRDLEDFSRMWMQCPFSIDDLKSGNIQIGFKWKNHSGAKVNIYLSADATGSLSYLTDQDAANGQASVIFGGTVAEVRGEFPVYLPASVFLKPGVLEDDKLFLIFEGVSEGHGQLVPVFKINSKEIEASTGVWMHLLNVRKMYERVKITPDDPDDIEEPSEHIDSSDPYSLPPEPNIGWVKDPWDNKFMPDPDEVDEFVVFVHGWNMTYLAAQKYGETMFKRLWQSGYKGRYAFVRWPTDTILKSYNISDYKAWKSGKGVALYVNEIPSKYSRNIIAHSMGNIVVGSALREGMKVDNYALLNAAVPAMCYDTDKALYSNNMITPDGDTKDTITKGLGFAGKITRGNVRDRMINFYLPKDFALGIWTVNNSISKPHAFPLDYYDYEPSAPSGEKLRFVDVSLFSAMEYRYLRSFHEAGAYVTASRTPAVGALGNTDGAINGKVNMDARYGFGTVHSAEWELRFQKTDRFYYDIMQELKLENAILTL